MYLGCVHDMGILKSVHNVDSQFNLYLKNREIYRSNISVRSGCDLFSTWSDAVLKGTFFCLWKSLSSS